MTKDINKNRVCAWDIERFDKFLLEDPIKNIKFKTLKNESKIA